MNELERAAAALIASPPGKAPPKMNVARRARELDVRRRLLSGAGAMAVVLVLAAIVVGVGAVQEDIPVVVAGPRGLEFAEV
jgi:hypothetical protein